MDGGIIVLVIIGIVLNMIIKSMRTKRQPAPPQPAQRPAGAPSPQAPTMVQPKSAPRAAAAKLPQAAKPAKKTQSAQPRGQRPQETAAPAAAATSPTRAAASNSYAEWFKGDAFLRGVIMSEILNPPLSRRR
jgi:hypothetical protein